MAILQPTLGEKSIELLGKDESNNAVDIQYATEKDYLKNIEKILEKHREYGKEYYIQVWTLQENFHRRHLPNIYKFMFVVRHSRPLPQHDTALFSYNNKEDKLLYHWSVPDSYTCDYLIEHESELPESERPLVEFSKKFCAGTLV